jgi:hypothetical protein
VPPSGTLILLAVRVIPGCGGRPDTDTDCWYLEPTWSLRRLLTDADTADLEKL